LQAYLLNDTAPIKVIDPDRAEELPLALKRRTAFLAPNPDLYAKSWEILSSPTKGEGLIKYGAVEVYVPESAR